MFSKKCLVPVSNRLRILKVHMQHKPLLQPARSAAMPGIFLGAAVSRHQWVHDWALELRIPGQGWFNMIQYDMMDWNILKQFNRSSEHAWCPQFNVHVCVCVCEFQASKWGVNEPERHFDLKKNIEKSNIGHGDDGDASFVSSDRLCTFHREVKSVDIILDYPLVI